MKIKRYTDKDYLNGISEHNSQIIKKIYSECFPMIRKMIIKSGGDTEKAKDIFQDAIMMIYHKSRKGEIKLFCKFSTYLYGVSKKLWMQELKSKSRFILPLIKSVDVLEEPEYINEYRNSILKTFYKHFNELSEDCRKIIRMHFNMATIDEIHSIMGYSNKHHTIDRKYRCKRSLIKRIMNDPSFKNIKNEYAG